MQSTRGPCILSFADHDALFMTQPSDGVLSFFYRRPFLSRWPVVYAPNGDFSLIERVERIGGGLTTSNGHLLRFPDEVQTYAGLAWTRTTVFLLTDSALYDDFIVLFLPDMFSMGFSTPVSPLYSPVFFVPIFPSRAGSFKPCQATWVFLGRKRKRFVPLVRSVFRIVVSSPTLSWVLGAAPYCFFLFLYKLLF